MRLGTILFVIFLSFSGSNAQAQHDSCTETFADFAPIQLEITPTDGNQAYSGQVITWFTDSQCMLIGSSAGLWLYDMEQPDTRLMLAAINDKAISRIAVNRMDATIAFAVAGEPAVYLLNQDGTFTTLDVYGQVVTEISYSPDGNLLAVASSNIGAPEGFWVDPQIQIWERDYQHFTPISVVTHFDPFAVVREVVFTPDNRHILIHSMRPGYLGDEVEYWDIVTSSRLWDYYELTDDLDYRPDFDPLAILTATMQGNTIAVGGLHGFFNDHEYYGNGIDIWTTEYPETRTEVIVNLPGGAVSAYSSADSLIDLDFISDSSILASMTTDGTVKVWNVSDGSEIGAFNVNAESPRQITYSPDDRFLAILANEELIIWNMDTISEYNRLILR